MQLRHI